METTGMVKSFEDESEWGLGTANGATKSGGAAL
jgi:hypothetical protein